MTTRLSLLKLHQAVVPYVVNGIICKRTIGFDGFAVTRALAVLIGSMAATVAFGAELAPVAGGPGCKVFGIGFEALPNTSACFKISGQVVSGFSVGGAAGRSVAFAPVALPPLQAAPSAPAMRVGNSGSRPFAFTATRVGIDVRANTELGPVRVVIGGQARRQGP